jgi:hypothetical protein
LIKKFIREPFARKYRLHLISVLSSTYKTIGDGRYNFPTSIAQLILFQEVMTCIGEMMTAVPRFLHAGSLIAPWKLIQKRGTERWN